MVEQLGIFEEPAKALAAAVIAASEKLTWKEVLAGEKEKPYFQELMTFVDSQRAAGKTIFPPKAEVFNALQLTPFDQVKVVIIGQDPYHGPNQAHGLCFSVKKGVPPPPSLINIYKELESDLGLARANHGFLENWARQGVLLLNAVLTVEANKPASHAGKGWETFTDRVISELNSKRKGLVFMLWGSYAQKKGAVIDHLKHHILQAPHPSPFSADRGFFGCKHFSKANEILKSSGQTEVDWRLN